MRTHYKNGDPITLLCGCDGCSPTWVNKTLCHEAGCPEQWRDMLVSCRECGGLFYPDTRFGVRMCPDCKEDWQ